MAKPGQESGRSCLACADLLSPPSLSHTHTLSLSASQTVRGFDGRAVVPFVKELMNHREGNSLQGLNKRLPENGSSQGKILAVAVLHVPSVCPLSAARAADTGHSK